jgi:hypothetical protein
MDDSSDSSEKFVGNTKQISPSKNWCFTFNNYDDKDIEDIFNRECISSIIIGKEVGSQGTRHLQGQITFNKKVRPKEMFDKRIHWEKTKKIQASVDYCAKEGDYCVRGYKISEKPYVIEIEKLYKWQENIIEIIKTKPDDRSIYWFHEYEGCAGKTTLQKYIYTKFNDVIVLGGKSSDMLNGIVEYKKTNKRLPKIVLLNIPRCMKDYVSYLGIEQVKDMFFYSGKYEGGMICGENPHVICFANEEPEESKLSADRWKIIDINCLQQE